MRDGPFQAGGATPRQGRNAARFCCFASRSVQGSQIAQQSAWSRLDEYPGSTTLSRSGPGTHPSAIVKRVATGRPIHAGRAVGCAFQGTACARPRPAGPSQLQPLLPLSGGTAVACITLRTTGIRFIIFVIWTAHVLVIGCRVLVRAPCISGLPSANHTSRRKTGGGSTLTSCGQIGAIPNGDGVPAPEIIIP